MEVRDGLIRAFFNAFFIKNMPTQRKMVLRTQFSKPLCLRSETSFEKLVFVFVVKYNYADK